MKKTILYLGLLLLLLNCQGQTYSSENCEGYYLKYVGNADLGEYDSADFYLSNAFNCDSLNLQFAVELYSLKINAHKTEEALHLIKHIQKLASGVELKVTEELLRYELNGFLDIDRIKEIYMEYQKKVSKLDNLLEKDVFYYVALSNFLNGKEKALNEIRKYEKALLENNKLLLPVLEEWILDHDSLYVLKKAFNIK